MWNRFLARLDFLSPRCISVISKNVLNLPDHCSSHNPLLLFFPFQRRRPQWSLSSPPPDDHGSSLLSSVSWRSRVAFVVFPCWEGDGVVRYTIEGTVIHDFLQFGVYIVSLCDQSNLVHSCSTSEHGILTSIRRPETLNLFPTLKSYPRKFFIPLPQVRYLLVQQDIATARSCLHNIYQLMRITFHVPAIRPMADPRKSGCRIRFGTILALSLLFSVVHVSASLSQLYCSNQNTGADFVVGKILA